MGSNPGYKELEFSNLVETSKASLIITAPDLLPVVHTVAQSLEIPDSSILIFAEPAKTPLNFSSWEELLHQGEEDWVQFDDEKIANETPACLVTTSGTTGLPKMAMLSHHAWVALNSAIEDPVTKPYEVRRSVASVASARPSLYF